MKRYAVVIEMAQGNYSAYAPDVPGCAATGDTVEEATRQIQEALELHFEGLREDGLPVRESKAEVAYVEVRAAAPVT